MRRSVIKSSPFTTFVSSFSTSSGGGRGRGGGGGFISPSYIFSKEQDPQPQPPPSPVPAPVIGQIGSSPAAVGRGRGRGLESSIPVAPIGKPPGGPSINAAAAGGAGRGKLPDPSAPLPPPPTPPVNRHIKAPPPKPQDSTGEVVAKKPSEHQRLSQEEARTKALGILSRSGGGRGGAQGFRGRGGGRGRGRGRGRGADDKDDDYATGLYLGEAENGEKLAKRLGPDAMNQLAEGFEEMASRVLPSPLDDAYEDALRTNFMIECEQEYFMPDFETNPDIDDTPPMSLEEALQKMKPFLMAYENIKTHEEWEEAIEETMKSVPLLKQIVDLYGGPDVVTALQQQKELQRVAETIPQRAPASITRFANNAVLSLQSNPGWGFDKKCQLMDKFVQEVSQQYK